METLTLLQKLIQIPSFSGKEEKLTKFILGFCKTHQIQAKLVSGNVIIHYHGKKRDKALIFNAHMDTVAGAQLSGKFAAGKVFGLGASDDKGAIASMLSVAKSFVEKIPSVGLWFVFVTDEETSGAGSKNFLRWFKKKGFLKQYKDIGAIIGEPTGLKNIEIGHRGNAFIQLKTNGVTGHSAQNYSSKNLAVDKMFTALADLKSVFMKWAKVYVDKTLGEPTLNITSLYTSSDSANKIPDSCTATVDIRTTPKSHNIIEMLLKNELGDKVSVSQFKEFYPPKIVKKGSRIVQICQKVLSEYCLSASLGTTDQGQFLDCGIDAVVLGPGHKDVMHQENEYIEFSMVLEAITIYRKIIDLW